MKGKMLIIGIVVAGFLTSAILPVESFIQENYGGNEIKIKTFSMSLSEPTFEEKGKYLSVDINEANSFLMETGKPVIPVITKAFTFPAGTEIMNVDVNCKLKEYKLEKKIEPSPSPVILSVDKKEGLIPDILPDERVYGSEEFYPSEPYEYKIGVGLKDDEHVLYVNVRCYAQYSPAKDKIYVPEKIDMKIKYKLPEELLFTADEYDMLIITDEKFASQLQPLIDHKNSIGIRTVLETTQEIYSNYNGRDEPEKIKYAIKDAIEKWGITYVLLAGGREGQTFEWYVPERRSNNDADFESGYASDLYYADIYKYDHGKITFEDWDSNGNGVFAEFSRWGERKDVMDYYPDVYVGRLPFRYSWEVDIVVNKIITYENTADDSWFKKAFVVGGDTSPPARDEYGNIRRGIYEGEMVADVAAENLKKDGFSIDKLYTSQGTFSNYEDIVNAFDKGAGFAYLSGHGNPGVWGNFWPDAETEEEFSLGFTVFDIWKYSNGAKLPVVVVGGCHNAQFNVTMQYLMPYNEDAVMHGEYYPHDGCSWMLLEEGGGSIASIGYTGYGYGYINQYCLIGLGGWIEPRFFHAYAVQGKEYLGEVHSQAITDYINIIDDVNTDQIDRKTIESWELLGDPSLKIGGVGSIIGRESNGNRFKEYEDETLSSDDVPTWEVGNSWTYEISNVDFVLNEVEERYIDIHLKAGELHFEVTEASSNSYTAQISIPDADVDVAIEMDLGTGDPPINISAHLFNISIEGNVYFEKSTLGITGIDLTITANLDLSSLPINFSIPPIIQKLLDIIPFKITINLQADFDSPYEIINFPINTDKTWGIPSVNVTVDGDIKSIWFRIIKVVNTFARLFGIQLIPPEYARLLPVIDIPELLNLFNISNKIQIPKIWDPLYHDIHPFKCASKTSVSVPAGTFSAYDIQMVRAIGQIYYSSDAENIVKIKGNFNDILPIVEDFDMELTNMEK